MFWITHFWMFLRVRRHFWPTETFETWLCSFSTTIIWFYDNNFFCKQNFPLPKSIEHFLFLSNYVWPCKSGIFHSNFWPWLEKCDGLQHWIRWQRWPDWSKIFILFKLFYLSFSVFILSFTWRLLTHETDCCELQI